MEDNQEFYPEAMRSELEDLHLQDSLNPKESEATVMIEIPISLRAVSLMKAYRAFTGESPERISEIIGGAVGAIVEAQLWDLAKAAMGERPGEPERQNIQQDVSFENMNRLADLGDRDNDDDDGQMIPKQNWSTETYAAPLDENFVQEAINQASGVKPGGVRDEDLENDLTVVDPEHEAASDAAPEEITDEAGMMKALGLINDYIAKQGKTPAVVSAKGKAVKGGAKGVAGKAISGGHKRSTNDPRADKRNKKLLGFKGKVQAFSADSHESSTF